MPKKDLAHTSVVIAEQPSWMASARPAMVATSADCSPSHVPHASAQSASSKFRVAMHCASSTALTLKLASHVSSYWASPLHAALLQNRDSGAHACGVCMRFWGLWAHPLEFMLA